MFFIAWLGQIVLWIATGWIVIVAARVTIKWGFLTYLIPILGPIAFAYSNWSEAKRPFILYCIGVAFSLLGLALFILEIRNGSTSVMLPPIDARF